MKTLYSASNGSSTVDRIERLSRSRQSSSGFRLTVRTDPQGDSAARVRECAALMKSDRGLIPGSKFLENHLLIEPVAALLEREEAGYRDLRKALVSAPR